LKQLEDCRTILKRELGVAPAAETLALLNAAPAPARNFAAAKPVIAIMPFDDLSDDQSQRYFSEGISREIATELARFREFVIRYCHPGQQTTAGSDYTISGSVRRSGPTIRISVELADTVSGTHYWGDRFVAGEQELFGLQDRIVQSIAARLAHHLNVAGLEKSQRRPPANLAAYELVLRGEAYFGDPELEPASIPLFTKALELDPQCARAYGSLGEVVMIQWTLDLDAPESELHRAVAMVEKAVALDPSDANIQANYANVLMWNRQFERAALHCTKALTLNPSSPVIRAFQGILHAFRGDPIEGARCFDQALALDPQFDPGWFTRNRAMVHFMARQYRAAADLFSHSPHRRHWAELYCAAAHAYLGEINDARRHVAIAHAMNPRQSIARCVGREPYARPEDSAHFAEGLRRAGLPE
jgi:TolB-like protein